MFVEDLRGQSFRVKWGSNGVWVLLWPSNRDLLSATYDVGSASNALSNQKQILAADCFETTPRCLAAMPIPLLQDGRVACVIGEEAVFDISVGVDCAIGRHAFEKFVPDVQFIAQTITPDLPSLTRRWPPFIRLGAVIPGGAHGKHTTVVGFPFRRLLVGCAKRAEGRHQT